MNSGHAEKYEDRAFSILKLHFKILHSYKIMTRLSFWKYRLNSLLPVSTTLAKNPKLWPRIFVKIRNCPNGILRGQGGADSREEKKTEVENLKSDFL
jgi:hypothetical protein